MEWPKAKHLLISESLDGICRRTYPHAMRWGSEKEAYYLLLGRAPKLVSAFLKKYVFITGNYIYLTFALNLYYFFDPIFPHNFFKFNCLLKGYWFFFFLRNKTLKEIYILIIRENTVFSFDYLPARNKV